MGGSSSGGRPELPPEVEKGSSFRLPVLSGRWVWSANPESGRVSVIDTRTLTVELATAGFAPSYLAALPVRGDALSQAIVLNARSHDATLLTLQKSGIESRTVATHSGANSWAVSPTGRWAIAWTDAEAVPNPDPTESFQEVTVIDTEAPSSTRLGVGYRPSRIFIQSDETRAFVVCKPGISVIELDAKAPRVSRDVSLSADPDAPVLDVAVVPDGLHAIARVEGDPEVRIVEIATGEQTRVALSGPVTDLDLVADGSAAIAVVRGRLAVPSRDGGDGGNGGDADDGGGAGAGGEAGAGGKAGSGMDVMEGGAAGAGGEAGSVMDVMEGGAAGDPAGGSGREPPVSASEPSEYGPSEIALLPILELVSKADEYQSLFVPELVGSVAVSDRGTLAVAYTTAGAADRVVVLPTTSWSAGSLALRSVSMRGPVESVFIAPDAEHAIATLQRTPGSTVRGAFGVVALGRSLPVKFQITDQPATGVAFAPDPSTSAIVTAAAGRTAYIVQMPSLLVDPVEVPSLPLSAGIVAEEGTAFVVQSHPEGRLSLIELETAEQRTLTGFELAAGAKP